MTTDPTPDIIAGDAESRDTVERFAADLRRLRLEADSPTLARLQSDTGISKSVLSDAFAGRQLPSVRTVDRIVRACGVDPATWIDRRDELAGLTGRTGEESVAESPAPEKKSIGRAAAIWIALGAFVAGAAGSAAAAALIVPTLIPSPSAPSAQIVVEDGVDPAQTACVDDAQVATGDTRADNSLLEIVWSDKCQAGWGRITRYDGLYDGNTVTIAIYPETAPDGPSRQEATEQDVQGAYTTLVVRPTPDTLLCAEGSFTVDGTRIDLGDPLCI